MDFISLKQTIRSLLPETMFEQSLGLTYWQWSYLFGLILIAWIADRLARSYIAKFTVKILSRSGIVLDDRNKKFFITPLGILFFAGTLRFGISLSYLPLELKDLINRGAIIAFAISAVLTCYHLVDVVMLYLEKKANETENKFDDILVPLLRKSAKTFVVLIGAVTIGEALTLDMKSLLAGLGIGGLAFALAAKDTVGNLFGSLTVVLDRPFRIGDWVVIDGKVEGMVEEVGLRSCRIRTFYDSLVSIPNGQLTNAAIDNYGQRTYRRLSTQISIQYDTPVELIETFCEGIRQIILKHPHTRKDKFHVYLNNMAASSLDIMLYVFWKVPTWEQELAERHRLLMDIIKLGRKLGVEFAFPTQTLHVINGHNPEYKKIPSPSESFHVAKELAHEIVRN